MIGFAKRNRDKKKRSGRRRRKEISEKEKLPLKEKRVIK